MAGDWIKMRTNLDTNPRVLQLADVLEVPPLHVVGMLWKLWSWADAHSLDGNALGVTEVTLDRFVDRPGFAAALRQVGWLEGRGNALSFPRFDQHNGQTAKTRAETKDRVRRHRSGQASADVTENALPEKRREEKKKSPPAPVRGLPAPQGEGEGLKRLVKKARDLGLKAAGRAIPQAVRQSDEPHVERLLEHYAANAKRNGWTPADLYFRLDVADAAVAPDADWAQVKAGSPGDDRSRLKAKFAERIRQMDPAEFYELAKQAVGPAQRQLLADQRPHQIKDLKSDEGFRVAVMRLLEKREA